jgi:hypothetical protein
VVVGVHLVPAGLQADAVSTHLADLGETVDDSERRAQNRVPGGTVGAPEDNRHDSRVSAARRKAAPFGGRSHFAIRKHVPHVVLACTIFQQ